MSFRAQNSWERHATLLVEEAVQPSVLESPKPDRDGGSQELRMSGEICRESHYWHLYRLFDFD